MPASAPTILVVDDDRQIQYVLRRILEEHGYDVRVADDGNGALAAIKRRPADIVLLDILMPDKDGLETVLQLHHEFPKVTVVAMSGATFDFLSTAEKFGAHYTISKPIHPDKLIALIEEIAARRRAGTLRPPANVPVPFPSA